MGSTGSWHQARTRNSRLMIGGAASALLAGLAVLVPAAAGATTAWSRVSSPNVGTSHNDLNAVACVSATSCTAVGGYNNTSGIGRTLIESWNGVSWSRVSSPNAGTHSNYLNAVACVSDTSCTAVGEYFNTSGIRRTLILSWNGVSWSRVSSPSVGANHNFLFGVSCLSDTSCTAVGAYVNTGKIDRTLIESWNGVSWSRVSSPNVGTRNNFLNAVSCVSDTSCTAVGDYANTGKIDRTLIESWNGVSWSRVSSPNAGSNHNDVFGVSCVSDTSCTAVGAYINTSGWARTLVLSWNGVSWSRVSSPNAGTLGNILFGVSCVSDTSCTAVGGYVNTSGIVRTLILSWNGVSWSRVSSPNAGTRDNFLFGVSCVSDTSCTAVGAYTNTSKIDRTLIASSG
jgi:hypothetical protein